MFPGGWNFTNHMQCNINFCVLLQDDMLSVRWLVFPNRTIPLGRKLTLNMHFSYTLPGSCFLSLFQSPSYTSSICHPHPFPWSLYHTFIFLIPTVLVLLHYSFFLLPSCLFPLIFPFYTFLFSCFLIFLFCQFCLLPLLSHSPQPAPRK